MHEGRGNAAPGDIKGAEGQQGPGAAPPVRRAKHIEQPVLSTEPNPLRWFKEPPTPPDEPAGDTGLQLEHTT